MRKVLYVILDGLADRPVAALGDRTPLEAAHTPHLDALAGEGQQGLVVTVGPGIAPESDVAVTAILGYDPFQYHAGRGLLEALGMGIPFRDGNLALRGNFATAGEGRRILDRRVGRSLRSEEAKALARAVQEEVQLPGAAFRFEASVGHRCVLVLYDQGVRLSAQISNTDPAYGRVGALGVAKSVVKDEVETCVPLQPDPGAARAAELVNQFTERSRRVLEAHPVNARRKNRGEPPANLVLLRDASDHVPQVPAFAERFGARFACFVEMPVERGIARLLGMGVVEVPASGRDPRVYTAWAQEALRQLDGWDGLYVHLKGPDEPGHDGDWAAKQAVVAGIDQHFFGPLRSGLQGRRDVVVAVTADHATVCAAGAHTDDPVPLLVWSPGLAPDRAGGFGESAAARGKLGTLRGVDVLPLVLELARRA